MSPSEAALVSAWTVGRRHGHIEQAQIETQLGAVMNRWLITNDRQTACFGIEKTRDHRASATTGL